MCEGALVCVSVLVCACMALVCDKRNTLSNYASLHGGVVFICFVILLDSNFFVEHDVSLHSMTKISFREFCPHDRHFALQICRKGNRMKNQNSLDVSTRNRKKTHTKIPLTLTTQTFQPKTTTHPATPPTNSKHAQTHLERRHLPPAQPLKR